MKEPKAKQPSEAEVEMEGKNCSTDNGEETKGLTAEQSETDEELTQVWCDGPVDNGETEKHAGSPLYVDTSKEKAEVGKAERETLAGSGTHVENNEHKSDVRDSVLHEKTEEARMALAKFIVGLPQEGTEPPPPAKKRRKAIRTGEQKKRKLEILQLLRERKLWNQDTVEFTGDIGRKEKSEVDYKNYTQAQ
jgi:hypothetical protein